MRNSYSCYSSKHVAEDSHSIHLVDQLYSSDGLHWCGVDPEPHHALLSVWLCWGSSNLSLYRVWAGNLALYGCVYHGVVWLPFTINHCQIPVVQNKGLAWSLDNGVVGVCGPYLHVCQACSLSFTNQHQTRVYESSLSVRWAFFPWMNVAWNMGLGEKTISLARKEGGIEVGGYKAKEGNEVDCWCVME